MTPEENELLTRIGPGTPMGEYFRRYWHPLFLAQELPGPDCDPVRTRILGEDLVAFRDSAGKVGVLDAFCPHRRAAMYYGRNEEGGLRCVYHGQKFDTDGRCLDYPAAPPGSKLKDKAFIKSYPTYETGGLIWVYLGPRELMPPRPPELPFTNMPTEDLVIVKYLLECNWLQNIEGDLDTEHIAFMHTLLVDDGTMMYDEEALKTDLQPRRLWMDTEFGQAQSTRWTRQAGGYYWRVNLHVLPSHMMIPFPGGHRGETSFWVPIDDTHTFRILVIGRETLPLIPGPDGEPTRLASFIPIESKPGTYQLADGVTIDTPHAVYRRHNNYGLDRQRQRTYNYTGMPSLPTEDQAITESMGPIHDRSQENLAAGDTPIIALRHRLMKEVTNFQEGIEPTAPACPEVFNVVPVEARSHIEDLDALLKEKAKENLSAQQASALLNS
ncbi:Rieske 2Fe-2S domain-containing protein [Mycobacterium sp. Aquia_216]|uniref:Rieske 2Fe-2S domain-containing protein n=1 Tax=Mycobacterium sp. Aquia_216 TaxID=2991729 RepID=UPI00227B6FA1|nr:Rieske 2Fe-2S domain-containing protein [Mycobacterium sp. Aquia_216]WAJ44306.1 Rieske 2Fe-2S domain-containing protein [Mycobacterium sp. Aquia_216]